MAGTHQVTGDLLLVTHSVTPGENGMRLDSYLKEYYRRKSREQIKRDIVAGTISVVRSQSPHLTIGKLKPSSQLLSGDEVQIVNRRRPEPPVDFNYKILYEDEILFVIEKPGNLPVHPAGRYYFNTLLVHLRSQGFTAPLKANREFFLVHRIDRETSGILVLAKNAEACAHLVEQFAKRKTEKSYLAIVKGRVEKEEFTVDLPIQRDPKSSIRLKMAPMTEEKGGLHAITRFKRLELAGNYSLLECLPKTGRQHQIRVHLEAAGYPIVGDKLYGIPEAVAFRMFENKTTTFIPPEIEARLLLPRHALHAAGIRFVHPLTGKAVEFQSPLPKDLQTFLNMQRSIT